MKETLHNGYIKIKPVENKEFVSSQNQSYEEIGIVLQTDERYIEIPIGARVKFDSFMAKKYPVEGKPGEYDWYIHHEEIVSHVAD